MTDFKVGDRVLTPDEGEGVVRLREEGNLLGVEVPHLTGILYYGVDELTPAGESKFQVIGDSVSFHGEPDETTFARSVHRVTGKIADLLIAKNKAYGDSALNPVRIFSKASRIEQLNVRIDDKISRIQRGTDFGDEDTVRDLCGYLLMLLIARESE